MLKALAAALVHDLGHGSFSHAFEQVGDRRRRSGSSRHRSAPGSQAARVRHPAQLGFGPPAPAGTQSPPEGRGSRRSCVRQTLAACRCPWTTCGEHDAPGVLVHQVEGEHDHLPTLERSIEHGMVGIAGGRFGDAELAQFALGLSVSKIATISDRVGSSAAGATPCSMSAFLRHRKCFGGRLDRSHSLCSKADSRRH